MRESGQKTGQDDLYRRLFIDSNATDSEIKEAYFRLVRKFNPESDPEGFKRIREAYETLHDKDKRKEYDAMNDFGTEIAVYIKAGLKNLERDDIDHALHFFNEALLYAPDLPFPHHLMGIAFFKEGKYERALREFTRALKGKPETVAFIINLAQNILCITKV